MNSVGPTGTTPETANVLSKVVVAADVIPALPITSPERNDTRATHATMATTVSVMAHVWRGRHHGRGSIVVAIAHLARGARADGRERATEAGRAALEVRKAARRAGPVTRSGTVLARWEGREDLGCPVQNSTTARRDLDGLFVQGTAVHAQTFGRLQNG